MGIGNSLTPPTEGTVSIRWPPRVMITDKLASYGAAKREVMPGIEHRQHKGLNNRAVNSHQPTRRRERLDLLKLLSGVLVGLFRSHAAREAETAFLRQQLVVLKLRLVQAGPRPRWRRAGKRAALLARYSSAPLIR